MAATASAGEKLAKACGPAPAFSNNAPRTRAGHAPLPPSARRQRVRQIATDRSEFSRRCKRNLSPLLRCAPMPGAAR
eukprot:3385329-Pyramimonas_sp.AAC.1